jgi:hypothetical protein
LYNLLFFNNLIESVKDYAQNMYSNLNNDYKGIFVHLNTYYEHELKQNILSKEFKSNFVILVDFFKSNSYFKSFIDLNFIHKNMQIKSEKLIHTAQEMVN